MRKFNELQVYVRDGKQYGSYEMGFDTGYRMLAVAVQAGCPVGCYFCPAGSKMMGNLSAKQILEQIEDAFAARPVTPGFRVEIFPRAGEPLLNLAAYIEAMDAALTRHPEVFVSLTTINPIISASKRSELMQFIGKWAGRVSLNLSLFDDQASWAKVQIADLSEATAMLGDCRSLGATPAVSVIFYGRESLDWVLANVPKFCRVYVIPFRDHEGDGSSRLPIAQLEEYSDILMARGYQVFRCYSSDDPDFEKAAFHHEYMGLEDFQGLNRELFR